MNYTLLILVFTQLLFTGSDLLARYNIQKQGLSVATFFSTWFFVFFLFRILATFGQLYVLGNIELGKTMALFGATSIVLANVLGFLVLNETLAVGSYLGVSLAVVAFLILATFR